MFFSATMLIKSSAGWWGVSSGCCVLFENCTVDASIFVVSVYERTVDVLAPGADEGRGRLRYASGSCQPSCDPRISEWGKPSTSDVVLPASEYIGCVEGTWGSETSQYPQEEKTTCDSVSSGERKRKRLNHGHVIPGRGCGRGGCGVHCVGSAGPADSKKSSC